MVSQTDLHFHLLPGLDDGPPSLAASLELAELAAADGTDRIVATPHVRGDFVTDVGELEELTRSVAAEIARAGLSVRVECGAELGHEMGGRLSQAELELVAQGPPGGRWLLVETPFSGLDEGVAEALDELRDRGFGIVLAHPERSAQIFGRCAPVLAEELARGTLLQINALSLLGVHGDLSRWNAIQLVAAGQAHVLGSDAHSFVRPPALTAGRDAAIEAGLPRSTADRLIGSAPLRLLERGLVPLPVPLSRRRHGLVAA
ncbi:MAG: capsular biosynthesis protein [Thermoleophilaceae bacterium]|nr:capsular biosynthesis protein [Thermoleophilaceae bacterium]